MEPLLAAVVLAGVVLAVIYHVHRRDFVVRLRGGRFTCTGRLAQRAALEQFLRDDLRIAGPAEVAGRRRRNGRLDLWFGGDLTPGQQQRIRNFLLTRH
jgi:hypothetical protein